MAGKVGSGIAKGVAAIGGAFGISSKAVTAIALALALTGTGVGVVSSTMSADDVARTSSSVDCSEAYQAAVDDATASTSVDEDAQMLKNAQEIYSVLKTYDPAMTNEQIAAVLSNWQAECSLDSTCVEGIYDEPYTMGTRKTAAMADIDYYTQNVLKPMYGSMSVSWSTYGPQSDGKWYCGIGISQWTGGGAKALLEKATSLGKDWSTLDFQLAYSLAMGSPCGGGGGVDFWKDYSSVTQADVAAKYKHESTVENYCDYFTQYYEGVSPSAWGGKIGSTHEAGAQAWLDQMASWSVDTTTANNVISMATQMGAAGASTEVKQAQAECTKCADTIIGGNESIAEAAVTYAYATKAEGEGNDGTELYRKVHDYVAAGDPYYMSCDRCVACAVRWAGADDDYPLGDTGLQLKYLNSSPKWTKIGDTATTPLSSLQPGDVLCLDGHTFLYVGHDLIAKVHPEDSSKTSYDSVSASYLTRSPGCGDDTSSIITTNNGQDWSGRGVYYIFRNTKPDDSDKYTHAADGISFSTKSGGVVSAGQCTGSDDDTTKTASGTVSDATATGDAATFITTAQNTPSPGHGLCAAWVEIVYQKAGFGPANGNACDLYSQWCTSSNLADLKPGMIVAVNTCPYTSASRKYGHVGIYIGNNTVIDNIGYIRTSTLSDWLQEYNVSSTVKWGWLNGRALM